MKTIKEYDLDELSYIYNDNQRWLKQTKQTKLDAEGEALKLQIKAQNIELEKELLQRISLDYLYRLDALLTRYHIEPAAQKESIVQQEDNHLQMLFYIGIMATVSIIAIMTTAYFMPNIVEWLNNYIILKP